MRQFTAAVAFVICCLTGCSTAADDAAPVKPQGTSTAQTVVKETVAPEEKCWREVQKRLMARWDMFVNGPNAEREADSNSWVSQGGWEDPAVATYVEYADAGRLDLLQGEGIMSLLAKKEPQIRATCRENLAEQQ